MACLHNCSNCRYALWSRYYPATMWEPEEPSVIDGCDFDHDAWDCNPEEGCTDWEYGVRDDD